MQYVNDDMDELFRKAAKDYPLNTGSADWDKVAKALQEPPKESPSSSRNNRRHLLWLLLLLPLPWICTRYIGEGGNGGPGAATERQEPAAASSGNVAASAKEKTGGDVKDKATGAGSATVSIISSPVGIDKKLPNDILILGASRRGQRENLQYSVREEVAYKNDKDIAVIPSKEEERVSESLGNPPKAEGATAPHVQAEAKEEITVPVKDSVDQDTATSMPSPPLKSPKPQRIKRFYAGVLGGADITSIKMQKVKKVGFDIGGVVGYAINNRWSVEAGLLSSEKAYYSSGEHLYKAYLLPGTELKEADGDCRMWEVPLVVRYHFKEGKRGGWFASGGASSYLMKEESYDYTYTYTATGQDVKRSRSYKSELRHLFAAAQLSGGYQWRVGKSMDLRIEPYIKLPLRKVGYYELPLTSFGVHAGITKKLF